MALTIVAAVVIGSAFWSLEEPAPGLAPPRTAQIDVLDGPNGQERIQIDATLYAPAHTPAPAVLLSHGFGEDKNSVAGQAMGLARRGFTVLTYSSRGFGNSSGRIALNAPEYEVADAKQILDWLARQPEVLRDTDGDPRVGVTGESYGGALSLLLAGSDRRVDAVAPVMTYNDLEQALLPNAASAEPILGDTPAHGWFGGDGVFKRAWAGLLFSTGVQSPAPRAWQLGARSGSGPPDTVDESSLCGNFTAEVCSAYIETAQSGRVSPGTRELLASVSPKRVTHNITAPTLLIQGERDSLFGLEQTDANARQITQAGARVKVVWYTGGHDGAPPAAQLRDQIADWFAFHLGGVQPVPDPGTGFVYDVNEPRSDGESPVRSVAAPVYPGLRGGITARSPLPLRGGSTIVMNPPGGSPAATSSVPGIGSPSGTWPPLAQDWPGQTAVFSTPPVDHQRLVSGVPRSRLSVSSVPGEPGTGEAVLFAKLYEVSPRGGRTLLGNAVAPLRIDLPASGAPVDIDVALPAVVRSLPKGSRIELAVSTTDQAYETPDEPAVYRIGLAQPSAVSLPSVPGRNAVASEVPIGPLLGIAGIALLALVLWLLGLVRRRQSPDVDADWTETPLMISGLSKSYGAEVPAVDGLSMRIERGQIVGLLGPNGAGKTTTLRMLLGLVHPTSGTIRIFGHLVSPGAAVLSRTGSLIESPGFLPYLSGVDNLRSYWASTGRPIEQARFDEVVRIAGLESTIYRKVRTYSQGVRQRLAIAQAMLGLPELLVLDEPANGLDPPQMRQLREVLRRYASTGRTVLLSSHLLAEVEQSCTHVVVVHGGKAVTSATVEELVTAQRETTFQVDAPEKAVEALRTLEGVGEVLADGERVHAELGDHSPAVAVNTLVAFGVEVERVGPRRRLEDTFLQLVGEER